MSQYVMHRLHTSAKKKICITKNYLKQKLFLFNQV